MASPDDWNRTDWSKLWSYNLHYFDDLAADEAATRQGWHEALVERWIKENPPARGCGWEPYPTSLRLVNWVKWALAGNTLDEPSGTSLAVQARWLRRRLEVHLLGNHLWANAKALVFAGTFFQGPEADGWRTQGLALLRRELAEQILDDGGHFERSPMYHAILLGDLLDLIQLTMVFPGVMPDADVEGWDGTVARMLRWLQVMTHPDGGIAFFNDAALSIAPSYAALLAYARSLGLALPELSLAAIELLPDTGYVRLSTGPAVLIADVGDIGPDYLPAHAHADTLSFELSLNDRRVLVNGGTSTYETGAERLRQRGTSAHNTVVVNGLDSSEVWSSFRVARRARPLDVAWGSEGEDLWLRAGHDGYARLRTIGRVDRIWRLAQHRLSVEDLVKGQPHSAKALFRAHPAFAFDRHANAEGGLTGEGTTLRWQALTTAAARVTGSTWHPRFGVREACQVLEVELASGRSAIEFSWA